jgi:nucleoside phosphorylase
MPERPRILVVAATPHELATDGDWTSLVCGVGPVEAAISTARAIAESSPTLILHVGIAGARRSRRLPHGAVVIGSEARYCDLGVSPDWAPGTVPAPPPLLVALRHALPHAAVLPIGTSGRVGGSAECDVEAMEGFAVLRAAALAGIPAIEVRTIANEIEETDRARWNIALACRIITENTPPLVAALRHLA